MPTRPKGSTPHQNATGGTKGGGQQAVTGSDRSPKEAPEAKRVVVNHEEQARPDEE